MEYYPISTIRIHSGSQWSGVLVLVLEFWVLVERGVVVCFLAGTSTERRKDRRLRWATKQQAGGEDEDTHTGNRRKGQRGRILRWNVAK
jgi:hypothetical protein